MQAAWTLSLQKEVSSCSDLGGTHFCVHGYYVLVLSKFLLLFVSVERPVLQYHQS